MSIWIQVFMWVYIFSCLGYISRTRIAESVSLFRILKNTATIFVCNALFCIGEGHSWTRNTLKFYNQHFIPIPE